MNRKIIKVIEYPMKLLCKGCIWIYKLCISPLLPDCCIYQPTCSTYTLQCIDRFGVFRGGFLGAKRIMRCNPKEKGGVDRVPEDIKGDFKWLI